MSWRQTHRHEHRKFLKYAEGCVVFHIVQLARVTRTSKKITKSKISPRIFSGNRQTDEDL